VSGALPAGCARSATRTAADGQHARAKARTELNVAIGYVDRAARRLAGEPGYLRHTRALERLSAELAEVLPG
jgi:hypothetical protein